MAIDGSHHFNSMQLTNGASLTYSLGTNLNLTVSGDFFVSSNSSILVSGRGYQSGGPGGGAGGHSYQNSSNGGFGDRSRDDGGFGRKPGWGDGAPRGNSAETGNVCKSRGVCPLAEARSKQACWWMRLACGSSPSWLCLGIRANNPVPTSRT